jgi:hypothetical protein
MLARGGRAKLARETRRCSRSLTQRPELRSSKSRGFAAARSAPPSGMRMRPARFELATSASVLVVGRPECLDLSPVRVGDGLMDIGLP